MALLVKVRGNGANFANRAASAFGAAAVNITPILDVPAKPAAFGAAATQPATWLRLEVKNFGGDNPWDDAHALLGPGQPVALSGPQRIQAIEPDIAQGWPPYSRPDGHAPEDGTAFAAAGDVCAFVGQEGKGGKAVGPSVAWNALNQFSEFNLARAHFGNGLEDKLRKIVIAHLDTGFDPQHVTKPANIIANLQRNFVDSGSPNDATDRTPAGMEFVRNRGHGTATLALLAGNRLDGTSPHWPGFTDFIGGAPFARIIAIRIADWVVRFTTGTIVQGFNHARQNGAHVLSMSMGGLSSQALVDAVNIAYDAGMVVVTAAGNNFAGTPMPRTIVFPARYRRVLAACGVMADGRAYANLASGEMQGSYGPPAKMDYALGAYTPNVPWAQIDCGKVVDMDGAGTSSATPQIASAAALWLAEHFDTIMQYPQPWMRVEAVRRALFTAAAKSTAKMSAAETREKIGQGVLKANTALAIQPAAPNLLNKLPPAQASWSWLDMLTGGGVSFAPGQPLSPEQSAMFRLELTQMAQRHREVDEAMLDPDLPEDKVSAAARSRYLEAALDHGEPSKPLRAFLEGLLGRAAGPATRPPPAPPVKRRPKDLPLPRRRLRVYALDPSIAKHLDTVPVNETILSLPWEDKLHRGPVGESIEVIDVDPASNRLYDPVDLNHPHALAQDGWSPSDGNPGFHQQMVYAVAMSTIGRFEKALGRRALWAPRYPEADAEGQGRPYEVPRLRLYPHALRTDNAYYSPERKAILFGYFPSVSKDSDATAPGSTVFSCLSSDIIAHEMSHALLDGLHRHFQDISNPDVPAFHEAFADIVALFQHFTIAELVRFEIGRARGRLSAASLLGGLARQFGEGIGLSGALRDYLGEEIAGLSYATTAEVHARGSILVTAVYNAFLRIVERRTADLIRIATGGTGILPDGALHPDLVNRLADETCKAAEQVLQMCIRALDYCPSVDITFGEYLRALITADRDLVPDDPLNYRVAFMEAFQSRGVLPRDVRTVSEETLAWGTFDEPKPAWLSRVLAGVDLQWQRDTPRSELFQRNEDNRWRVWRQLKQELRKVAAADPDVYRQFGLMPGVPRYDQGGTEITPVEAGDTTFNVYGVRPARRVAPDGSFLTEAIVTIEQRRAIPRDGKDPKNGFFWFRGGATLILNTRKGQEEIRYSIIKNSSSTSRLERQRQVAEGGFLSPLRALYFGKVHGEPFALMHTDRGR